MKGFEYYDEEIDQERLDKWSQTVKDRPLPGKITIFHLGPIEWPKQPTDRKDPSP